MATTWFYYDNNGQKQGPITTERLKGLTKQGVILPDTMVENESGRQVIAEKIQGLHFSEMRCTESVPVEPSSAELNPFSDARPPVQEFSFENLQDGIKEAIENNDGWPVEHSAHNHNSTRPPSPRYKGTPISWRFNFATHLFTCKLVYHLSSFAAVIIGIAVTQRLLQVADAPLPGVGSYAVIGIVATWICVILSIASTRLFCEWSLITSKAAQMYVEKTSQEKT